MKGLKKLIVAGLTGAIVFGSVMTAHAAQWVFDGPESWQWWYQRDDGSYPVNQWEQIDGKWYSFDSNGYMNVGWYQDTEGKWFHSDASGAMDTTTQYEGGYYREDGSFSPYEVVYMNGKLSYFTDGGGSVDCTIDWKNQLAGAWYNTIGGSDEIREYTLDYQLPSNWLDVCPSPLLEASLLYPMYESWAGGNWGYQWNVDGNNVLHIVATFSGY